MKNLTQDPGQSLRDLRPYLPVIPGTVYQRGRGRRPSPRPLPATVPLADLLPVAPPVDVKPDDYRGRRRMPLYEVVGLALVAHARAARARGGVR
jgi:hypothetical protein